MGKETISEAWVRVVGLPLHLWSREVFKRIGDVCGAFIEIYAEWKPCWSSDGRGFW